MAYTLALIGYKMEGFMMAYAGVKQAPKFEDWVHWDTAAQEKAEQEHSSEDDRAAWGDMYDVMREESKDAI